MRTDNRALVKSRPELAEIHNIKPTVLHRFQDTVQYRTFTDTRFADNNSRFPEPMLNNVVSPWMDVARPTHTRPTDNQFEHFRLGRGKHCNNIFELHIPYPLIEPFKFWDIREYVVKCPTGEQWLDTGRFVCDAEVVGSATQLLMPQGL